MGPATDPTPSRHAAEAVERGAGVGHLCAAGRPVRGVPTRRRPCMSAGGARRLSAGRAEAAGRGPPAGAGRRWQAARLPGVPAGCIARQAQLGGGGLEAAAGGPSRRPARATSASAALGAYALGCRSCGHLRSRAGRARASGGPAAPLKWSPQERRPAAQRPASAAAAPRRRRGRPSAQVLQRRPLPPPRPPARAGGGARGGAGAPESGHPPPPQ